MKHIFYAFALLFLVTSCGKDDEASTPLTPEPENPVPQNTAPELADQSFTVAENITDTTVIGTITATDTEEDALTYSLTTNSNDLFVLTETGELSLATGKLLNYDVAQTHTLTIEVTDATNTTTANITITITNSPDVYIVGSEYNGTGTMATLWKNGVATILSDIYSRAYDIAISGEQVYIAGSIENSGLQEATLWKNETAITLSNAGNRAEAKSVSITETGNVYIAGYEHVENYSESYVKVWNENGQLAFATLPSINVTSNNYIGWSGSSSCLYTTGSDVYVTGFERFGNGINRATLWRNGIPEVIEEVNHPNPNSIYPNSVYVSGTNTYVAGSKNEGIPSATLWKNGEKTKLSNSNNIANANSVYVSGNDVYVVGKEWFGTHFVATLWKNDEVIRLTDIADSSTASAVFVLENDVYIVGSIAGKATLWINGEGRALSNATSSHAYGLFVKP
ncbi:cadherin repeat domain-containing protein [Aquimarina algiphila]|uniref:cadherin repeat domain-containing protein n=1 Tax=Aquimarina algiphila TaxID=2047982 RepID=UPI00232ABD59|nr:cadherin repeat domain-containing protein [Aquimarina algiphila]